jgi:NADP-dependent 3-hydroxy acid dehydrogenase YdfG
MTAFTDVSHLSLHELISLRGKNAVVTGAAQGIGQAIARRLTEAGASLLLVDQQGKVQSVADALLSSTGGQITPLVGDVKDLATARHAARRAADTFGRLDIWVNDAGIYPVHPSLDLPEAVWQHLSFFDRWEATGATGWNVGTVLPYFVKSENDAEVRSPALPRQARSRPYLAAPAERIRRSGQRFDGISPPDGLCLPG